jgi:maleylpyruvate isomerase
VAATAAPEYRAVNPQMRVPTLKLQTGEVIVQSLAIIGYLNEVYPQPPLLPRDPIESARVRAVSQIIACDIHPLNNLGTLQYLKNEMGQDQAPSMPGTTTG